MPILPFIYVSYLLILGSNQTYQYQIFGQSGTTSGQAQDPPGSELTLPNLFASASKSVVQVTIVDPQTGSQQGIGSGFVYDSLGHIATNNHVVAFNLGNFLRLYAIYGGVSRGRHAEAARMAAILAAWPARVIWHGGCFYPAAMCRDPCG